MKDSVLYFIRCPFTNKVRYIGKTVDFEKRKLQHLQARLTTPISKWIFGLKKSGAIPVFEKLNTYGYFEAYHEEKKLIKIYSKKEDFLLNQEHNEKYELRAKVKRA